MPFKSLGAHTGTPTSKINREIKKLYRCIDDLSTQLEAIQNNESASIKVYDNNGVAIANGTTEIDLGEVATEIVSVFVEKSFLHRGNNANENDWHTDDNQIIKLHTAIGEENYNKDELVYIVYKV